MEKWQRWLNVSYGKKLIKYHRWNAWIILLLAVTGILLYFPNLRGWIAQERVLIKDLHIVLGILSIIIIFLYLPLFMRHVKQIWKKANQRYNLWFVLFLLVGWSLSGLVLAFYRHLPAKWSSAALVFHDLFTYIGIPYAIYHSVSRSRLLKKIDRQSRLLEKNNNSTSAEVPQEAKLLSRRSFIRIGTGAFLAILIGPFFYRWLSQFFTSASGPAQVSKTPQQMLPEPKPLPGSMPPKGGGGQGTYRMYTVTDVPTFTSSNWKFEVTGLVNHPKSYSWQDFLKLTRKVSVRDFHCVTGWSVYHVTWEGVVLSDLIKAAGVKSNAKYVKFYSGDGVYTDSLTLNQAQMKDVMVAVLRDGKPIPSDFGGPARLIVPEMYAYKSVKWLNKIELIDHDYTGYWEQRGYQKDAWYRG